MTVWSAPDNSAVIHHSSAPAAVTTHDFSLWSLHVLQISINRMTGQLTNWRSWSGHRCQCQCECSLSNDISSSYKLPRIYQSKLWVCLVEHHGDKLPGIEERNTQNSVRGVLSLSLSLFIYSFSSTFFLEPYGKRKKNGQNGRNIFLIPLCWGKCVYYTC